MTCKNTSINIDFEIPEKYSEEALNFLLEKMASMDMEKLLGIKLGAFLSGKRELDMENYTVRYSLIVNKFVDGIEAIRKSSRIMAEIFEDMPGPKSKLAKNNFAYEELAMQKLMDTIYAKRPLTVNDINHTRRVYFLDNYEVDYINDDGILFSWRIMDVADRKSPWVFWILCPSEWYQEKLATEPMGDRLEHYGFIKEVIGEEA